MMTSLHALPKAQVHNSLPSLFIPGSLTSLTHGDERLDDYHHEDVEEHGGFPTQPETETHFLDRARRYSAIMHAHATHQFNSPTGTIPAYARVMHAHHVTQIAGLRSRRTSLIDRRCASENGCCVGKGNAGLGPTSAPGVNPHSLAAELQRLGLQHDIEDVDGTGGRGPLPPNNSPVVWGKKDRRVSAVGDEIGRTARAPERSTTDPLSGDAAGVMAGVRARDFGAM